MLTTMGGRAGKEKTDLAEGDTAFVHPRYVTATLCQVRTYAA